LLAAPIDFLLRVDERGLTAVTDARLVLESGVAELAALRATPETIEKLQALAAQYEECIDDVQHCIELDVAFHQELAAGADSPILSSLVATMAALGLQSRTRTAQSLSMRTSSHSDYVAITQAMAARDAAAARGAMVRHLTHVQDSVDVAALPADAGDAS
jgi:DNA-binding FadR family transcriptional regulator